MIELALIGAILGAIVMVVCSAVMLWLFPRWSRPEVREKVRAKALMVFAGTWVGAIAWAFFVNHSQEALAQDILASYCGQSGEKIYRTAGDVEGILVRIPSSGGGRPDPFLDGPDRSYRFVEFAHFGHNESVAHYEASVGSPALIKLQSPAAKYGFTWTELARLPERNLGVSGVEALIYALDTKEILARRVIFHRVERAGTHGERGIYHSCPQYDEGGESSSYADYLPRDSYAFISRVLVPPALPPQQR